MGSRKPVSCLFVSDLKDFVTDIVPTAPTIRHANVLHDRVNVLYSLYVTNFVTFNWHVTQRRQFNILNCNKADFNGGFVGKLLVHCKRNPISHSHDFINALLPRPGINARGSQLLNRQLCNTANRQIITRFHDNGV